MAIHRAAGERTKGETHGRESNETDVVGNTSSHDDTILLIAFSGVSVSPEHTGRAALLR
jgi:hypothetical protein